MLKLHLVNPSEATYKANHAAILRYSLHADLPSYYRTTHLISEITGIELVVHNMCINLCIIYTSPFLNLEACPMCLKPQYDQFKLQLKRGKKWIACQKFHTIPIRPQLQALYHKPESTTHTQYLCEERVCASSQISTERDALTDTAIYYTA